MKLLNFSSDLIKLIMKSFGIMVVFLLAEWFVDGIRMGISDPDRYRAWGIGALLTVIGVAGALFIYSLLLSHAFVKRWLNQVFVKNFHVRLISFCCFVFGVWVAFLLMGEVSRSVEFRCGKGGVIWCEYGNLMRSSVFIFLAVFSAPFFSLIFSSAFFWLSMRRKIY